MAATKATITVRIEPSSLKVLENLVEAEQLLSDLAQPWNQDVVLEIQRRLRRVRKGLTVVSTE